ncbi:butyrophilin subfamily 3 member A1-like [Alosa pseudoharengus]|uniref:butyrophilin subfamily 3 member A1-like n=1 Tax=Alosa pseudoharengus TaxID=34774 RepID=UPI003F89F9C4
MVCVCSCPSLSKHWVCFWVILLFLCRTICDAGSFQVVGPASPLYVVTGEDLVLPCSLKPSINAEGMTVQWFRLNHQGQGSLVHLYQDRRNQNDKQMQSYMGRTSLFKDELKNGNASLKLRAVQMTDEGDYKCFVQSTTHQDDGLIKVLVRGIGEAPLVSLEGYQRSGISLVCESGGWMPKPAVDWLDSEGRSLPAEAAEVYVDSGAFRVKRQLLINKDDTKRYICRVSQKDDRSTTEKEVVKEAVLHISSDWFTPLQPLKERCMTTTVFFICLPIVAVLFAGLILFIYQLKSKLRNKKKEYLDTINCVLEGEPDTVTPNRKVICIQHIGPDFDLVELQRDIPSLETIKSLIVDVRLDADTNHPLLDLSDDGKEVRCIQTPQDLPDNPERFDEYHCVLGFDRLIYDRFYYEVKVRGKSEWALGVMRETMSRKGSIPVCSEEHHMIWLKDGHYWANSIPEVELVLSERPQIVGVFVDFEKSQVSFYDAVTGSLICSFRGLKFAEGVYPMFDPGAFSDENAAPLVINPSNTVSVYVHEINETVQEGNQ